MVLKARFLEDKRHSFSHDLNIHRANTFVLFGLGQFELEEESSAIPKKK